MKSMRSVVIAIFAAALIVSWAIIERYQGAAVPNEPAVVSNDAPPRQPISITDSNNDGVPDWQEALQKTEPLVINTSSTPSTDPDTLTSQFAYSFAEQMLRNQSSGYVIDSSNLVRQNAEVLLSQAADTVITRNDIVISSDSSLTALRQYGNTLAIILDTYSDDYPENEARILLNAIEQDDAALLAPLEGKEAGYRNYVEKIKALPVPPLLVNEHITLLQSFVAISNDITGMRAAFEDPALTLVRIQRYQRDAESMLNALDAIYDRIEGAGVTWSSSDAVSGIIY